jgi:hypothetical protein
MSPQFVTVDTPAPAVQLIYDFISPAEESYIKECVALVQSPALCSPFISLVAPYRKVNAVGGDSSKLWGWKELNGRR